MSSAAAVWLSLHSPAHGRPAGCWLRELLLLSFSSAPVPAFPPELPVGQREPSVLQWRPSPTRLLLLPATHARWTFCLWGPWLWCSRWIDWFPSQAAGGLQLVSVCLTSLTCCPPITLPCIWQPTALLSRPASPLSHKVTGKITTEWYSSWFALWRALWLCWYLHRAWRNQDKKCIYLTWWKRIGPTTCVGAYFTFFWTLFLNWDTWTLCPMWNVFINSLLTAQGQCYWLAIIKTYLWKHSAGDESCCDHTNQMQVVGSIFSLTDDVNHCCFVFILFIRMEMFDCSWNFSRLLPARASHVSPYSSALLLLQPFHLTLESTTVTWLLEVLSKIWPFKQYRILI